MPLTFGEYAIRSVLEEFFIHLSLSRTQVWDKVYIYTDRNECNTTSLGLGGRWDTAPLSKSKGYIIEM